MNGSQQLGDLHLPEVVSPQLADLMIQLLHPYARERPGVADLKAHTFFTDMNWARLSTGEMVSPLQDRAERVQAMRADDLLGPPQEDSYAGSPNEQWLQGYDYIADDDDDDIDDDDAVKS